jgi:CHAT domain-containing protein
MRSADEHLTPQEIDQLLFGADDSKDNAGGGAAPEAQQHLSGCAVCQSVAKKYTKADSLLRGLSSGNKGLRNPDVADKLSGNQGRPQGPIRSGDCPADETWPSLAAGLMREEEAARYVSHAAQCDWCGPLLKESMEDLAQDVTAEEQEALEKLPSASPGWQRAMAKKMAAASGNTAVAEVEKTAKSKGKGGFGWWPKLVWAGSGLAVLIVGVLVGIRLTREPDVNQLLAQAYTEQRTIELRMPGAAYGPMRVERGAEGSRLNRPSALLDAEALIAHKLSSEPENASFLQMRGRADLMEWNYEAAIKTFKHALDLEPKSLSLKVDLASAYFERAQSLDRAIDYGIAIELLGQVLDKNPDNTVALFNHAISCENMLLYRSAIEDWEHYLRVEPNGAWSQEAQKHLLQIRKKVEEHSRESAEPVLAPEAFISSLDLTKSGHVNPIFLSDEYLDTATRVWLPQSFPISKKLDAKTFSAQIASIRLSIIIQKEQADSWLADMLRDRHSILWSQGLLLLSSAISANSEGKPQEALRRSIAARDLFQRALSKPGILRSKLEEIYSLDRSSKPEECLQSSRELMSAMRGVSYSWLGEKLLIEQAVCLNMLGRLQMAEQRIENAMELSRAHRHSILYLRALGIAASNKTLQGDPIGTWNMNREGLTEFWKTRAPAARAYQFLDDLSISSERLNQSRLSLTVMQEAVFMVNQTQNISLQAMAAFRLAKLELVTSGLLSARKDFEAANHLFSTLPDDDTTRLYRAYGEIGLARIEAGQGQVEAALDRLKRASIRLENEKNHTIAFSLHLTRAELHDLADEKEQAERDIHLALDIGDSVLENLPDPRKRAAWIVAITQAYRSLVRLSLEKGNSERALELWEEMRGLPFRTTVRSTSALRDVLPELQDKTVISYAVLGNDITVWLFDDRGIHSEHLNVDLSELVRIGNRFARECSEASSDVVQLKKDGRTLYDSLIAPIAGLLKPQRMLVIEVDTFLAGIPLKALVDPNGDYFGKTRRIVVSPAFDFSRDSIQPTNISVESPILVVAAASTRNNDIPLADVLAEASAVARKFAHSKLLVGGDVNDTNLYKYAQTATIFHFAGHSVNTLYSQALPLSGNIPISFDQTSIPKLLGNTRVVSKALRHFELVVLSACSTAVQQDNAFGDPGGLAGDFLLAGARSIVASSWDVDSKITEVFMERFYDALVAKSSIATALQEAENMIRANPATEHPYFWAAFNVYGRG